MFNKIVSLREKAKQENWHFPFSQEEVQQFRFSVKPGEVTWYVPKDVLKNYPDQLDLYYTNVLGRYIVISATEKDLVYLHDLYMCRTTDALHTKYLFYGQHTVISSPEQDNVLIHHLLLQILTDNKYAEYIVYPHTDDSPTKKTAKGYRMKVDSRNLALRERMDRYNYTMTVPVQPTIALGRYLVIPAQPENDQNP